MVIVSSGACVKPSRRKPCTHGVCLCALSPSSWKQRLWEGTLQPRPSDTPRICHGRRALTSEKPGLSAPAGSEARLGCCGLHANREASRGLGRGGAAGGRPRRADIFSGDRGARGPSGACRACDAWPHLPLRSSLGRRRRTALSLLPCTGKGSARGGSGEEVGVRGWAGTRRTRDGGSVHRQTGRRTRGRCFLGEDFLPRSRRPRDGKRDREEEAAAGPSLGGAGESQPLPWGTRALKLSSHFGPSVAKCGLLTKSDVLHCLRLKRLWRGSENRELKQNKTTKIYRRC